LGGAFMGSPAAGQGQAAMQIVDLDLIEPLDAARRLADLPNLVFLDSAMRHDQLGRFSYVAADPFAMFRVERGVAHWNGEALQGDPFEHLADKLNTYRQATMFDLEPFQGGAVGFIAYDHNRNLERLPAPDHGEPRIPEVLLYFYDVVISFDHVTGACHVVSSGWPATDRAGRRSRARNRAEAFAARLKRPAAAPSGLATAELHWQSNFTPQRYAEAVTRTVEYIRAGDIFQANISQRFWAPLPRGFSPRAFYERLREINPATFAAYLDCGDFQIASSSPERFVKVVDDMIETRPIKGTAPRSPDPHEDARRAAALVGSEKDWAENVMIVDLLRNDLSHVCTSDSVNVPILCGLESYASVHHLVSVVTGQLRQGLGPVELLRSSFPGGSVTGAPKIRAMEIITEIERHARGVYCGSIGWLGFDGAMDTNIAIRTVTFRDNEAVFNAGGGVTLLSDPVAEYEETLDKAKSVFDAFRPARVARSIGA
jgi:para-aminobenzoate synthetase component 1